jgi:ankyrin repeat protein
MWRVCLAVTFLQVHIHNAFRSFHSMLSPSAAAPPPLAPPGQNQTTTNPQQGHIEVVRALIHAEVNINRPSENGASPLYIACQKGRLDAVQYLTAGRSAAVVFGVLLRQISLGLA